MSSDSPAPSPRAGSGSKPAGMWQPPTLEEMQAMLPHYRFESLLGRGGMGAVYKAVQVSLERPVAIKVLPGDLIDDADAQFAERFKNEARTMAKMNHPAIVNVYDFGETQTGLLFIVMEFIDGTDVAKMISSQGKLPEDYALSITAHVCDALNYAHRNGVIHRDIKPANILINMDGAVKVADFGLAKQSDAGASGLTKTNMAMGTPDFVAPEALIPGMPLDGRADLYAIGVMLYQMLTGEIPRGMWTMPGLKLGTDPRFDAIIGKAMQTDREARYQSAAAIRQDLDAILTTPRALTQQQPAAVSAQPAQTTQTAQKPATHGPRAPQGQKPAEKPQNAPPPPKKSSAGLMLGLGVTVVLLAGGYFLMKPSPQVKPPVVAVVQAAARPVAPPKPVPMPAPVSKPVVLPALPPPPKRSAKQTLDLLALADPMKDRIPVPGLIAKNEWKREGSALVFVPDGKSGKLAAPVALQCGDYEIELKVKKHSGNDRIHVDVPLKNGRILPLILNAQGRKVLNEKEGLDWGGVSSGEFDATIRVIDGAGASDRIIVERKSPNPRQLADWSGDLDKLAKAGEDHPGFPKQPVTSVFVMRDQYAVERWTLRVFEGEAKVLREIPVPQSQPAVVAPPVAAVAPAMPESATAVSPKGPAAVMPVTPVVMPVPVTDVVSIKLADLEARFQTAFDREAGTAYKAQLATLNTGYAAALDRALAAAAKAGRLDEAVALREEKERMASGKGLPPEDLDTLPAAVKKLRGTWRSTEAGYAKLRDAKAAPLFEVYDKALEAYQTELTKQNQIDEALRVKTARDELVTRRGGSAAPPEEKAVPAKSSPGASTAAVAVEASSSWRKAAEWILAMGGEVRIRRHEGGDATVRDAKELLGGRFDILNITLDLPTGKGAQVTDDDLTRLNGLRSIESVRMSHLTAITGSGFAALAASADSMRSFAAYNMPLKPQHMGWITQFKNLRLLELNRIETLPAEALTRIRGFKELTQLRLLGQMDLDDKALLELAGLTKLTELSIPGTPITDEGLVALKGMKALVWVDLSGCKGITGSGLVNLTGAKELARLQLSQCNVDDAALARLSGCAKLRELLLSHTAITDAGIKHFAQIKALESLELGAKGITGATLSQLSGCNNLLRLDLFDRTNPGLNTIDDAALQSLAAAELPKLNELSFPRSRVTDAGMASLRTMKLTKLRLDESPGIEGLRHLAAITTLEYLELGRGNLTDEGLAVLGGLKSLTTLISTASQVTDAGLKVLQDMRALKMLILRESKATQAGMDALSKARPDLKVNK